MTDKTASIEQRTWFPAMVWVLRILVGATFVMSGFVKAVDLWGFVFKIEEYLGVWGITQPRSLVVVAALLISSYEFVFGALLMMGCYKRLAVGALGVSMAVWLPLTLYVWIADPVADCGCFGDFWVISNFWTFVKNLLLTGMLVGLAIYNQKLKSGLYEPAIQWIVGAILTLYIIVVALYGYNIQPMLDFRPYPVGTSLSDDTDDTGDGILLIYEKDGKKEAFTVENLPDSTWIFVERQQTGASGSVNSRGSSLTLYDSDGEDVTDEAIAEEGKEILLVIPEPQRFDISYSYFLNDLEQWGAARDIPMVCIIGGDGKGIEIWQDLSMASYPIYSADDTILKELSRGVMSLVLLDDGVIQSKFTLGSIGGHTLDSGPQGDGFLDGIAPRPARRFKALTGGLAALLLLIFLFQSLILAVSRWIRRKYQKNDVNLQCETDGGDLSVTDSADNNNTYNS